MKIIPLGDPLLVVPGVINQNAIYRLNQYRAEVTSPGIDIVAFGDSILGTLPNVVGSEYRNYGGMIAVARRILQQRLNPTSVPGGMGFIHITNGSTFARNSDPINSGDALTATDTYTNGASADGVGARMTQVKSGATRYFGALMRGDTTPTTNYLPSDKTRTKSFRVIARLYASGPTIRVDSSVASWPAAGAGTVTGTFATANATTVYGAKSGVFTLASSTVHNRIIARGGASGNDAYIDGYFFYNLDETSGIRVSEVGNPGTKWADWSANSLDATIGTVANRSSHYLANPRVAIISSLINDGNHYPTTTVSAFKDYARDAIQKCVDNSMNVIYLIPPKPIISAFYDIAGDGGLEVYTDGYLAMVEAVKELVAEFPSHLSILDLGFMNDYATYATAGTKNIANGITESTGTLVHLGVQGHNLAGKALADLIYRGLTLTP